MGLVSIAGAVLGYHPEASGCKQNNLGLQHYKNQKLFSGSGTLTIILVLLYPKTIVTPQLVLQVLRTDIYFRWCMNSHEHSHRTFSFLTPLSSLFHGFSAWMIVEV